jgi:formylglycine-generating enzyme required for sulfatase activity
VAVVCVMAAANAALSEVVRGIALDFVTIGRAGNAGDTRADGPANPFGCGAVGYDYRIGKYEVANTQWDAFTAAAGAPTGSDGGYAAGSYYSDAQHPANNVSWYEAAQFCNYLTSGNKSLGVYQFSGSNANPGHFLGIDRTQAQTAYGVIYFLPTEDEWYKAAYYKPDGSGYSLYANGTDIAPIAGVQANFLYNPGMPWHVGTGLQEQNGTFDMMGNVLEWNETICGYGGYENTPFYGLRGGSCYDWNWEDGLKSSDRGWNSQDTEYGILGFRVASIPEPATLLWLGLGVVIVRSRMPKRGQRGC